MCESEANLPGPVVRLGLTFAALLAAIALSGCITSNKSSSKAFSRQTQDIEAIKQLAAAWRAAWLAGDAASLLALYGDQPVLMPQDQPVVIGKEAIRLLYQSALKDYSFTSQSRLMEVEASGDWGFFWSTYTLTATPKAGGTPVKGSGKSVFIVKRGPDGAWKIVRLIDNSDGLPAEQRGR